MNTAHALGARLDRRKRMLQGQSMIGGASSAGRGTEFWGVDPASGERLEPAYRSATAEDVNRAAELAEEAFAVYGRGPGRERGRLLRAIAAEIEAIAEPLQMRAYQETALPMARLTGETARTVNQLKMFAEVAEEGSWAMARIDRAQPERKPLPRSDLRSVLRPLGPVAVFGASNFPLAFSVAGGDTASALAAGNAVIVKAHPAHPGTSEMVGQAIAAAVRKCGLPAGVFALLFDAGTEVGAALVQHPLVKAVGFTGSLKGGRALMALAAARPEPIPCFMEMGSANPLVVLPEALSTRGEAIAKGLFGSFTMGVGQFCTKPGLVYVPRNAEGDALAARLVELVKDAAAAPMLTERISKSFCAGVAERKGNGAVELLAEGGATDASGAYAAAALFEVNGATLLREPELAHELFGPGTLLVRYEDRDELLALARALEGQLTASVHGTDADLAEWGELLAVLERKAGRLIVNGYPTGVEVCDAMVHGGPYPATSDGRTTSVGSQAIYRFARPVCYQDAPQGALPEELKDANPLGILRMVDGAFTREPV
jgi:NADP-dependent aldehyde dehydrogenase